MPPLKPSLRLARIRYLLISSFHILSENVWGLLVQKGLSMRINFASKKHAENVARRIKQMLSGTAHERPNAAVTHGLAQACGYRNWNELLGHIGKIDPTPVDQDLNVGDVSSRYGEFSHRLAEVLGVPKEITRALTEVIRPFSSHQKVASISDAFIRMMAQRISSPPHVIEPINKDGSIGFRVVSPAHTQNFRGRQVQQNTRSHEICVAADGRIVSDGFNDYEEIMSLGGLWDGDVVISDEISAPKAVVDVLSRLDRQVLHLHRCAGDGSAFSYNEAFQLDRNIPLFKLVLEMPGIAAVFTLAYRNQYYRDELVSDRYDILGSDPFGDYCRKVLEQSKKAWPQLDVTPERVRFVAKKFLSIPVGSYAIDLNLPAFLCHMPDFMFPKNTSEAEAAVQFVDMTGSFFRYEHGLRMSPVKFAEEFIEKAGGSWAVADKLRNGWLVPGQTIGCSVLGAAAFECGYEIHPGEFEDEEGALCDQIGTVLVTESGVGFFSAVEALDVLLGEVDLNSPEDDAKVAKDYEALSKSALVPESQRGSTATKLLECYGIDIQEVISGTWPEHRPR